MEIWTRSCVQENILSFFCLIQITFFFFWLRRDRERAHLHEYGYICNLPANCNGTLSCVVTCYPIPSSGALRLQQPSSGKTFRLVRTLGCHQTKRDNNNNSPVCSRSWDEQAYVIIIIRGDKIAACSHFHRIRFYYYIYIYPPAWRGDQNSYSFTPLLSLYIDNSK